MRKLIAAACVAGLGTLALVPLDVEGQPASAAMSSDAAKTAVPDARPAQDAARRVSLAFTLDSFDPKAAKGRGEPKTIETTTLPDAESPAPEPVRVSKPARAWLASDRSLQRGDIIVRDGDALVFEGVKNGKRHFRTVGPSRLVSAEERERILKSVRN